VYKAFDASLSTKWASKIYYSSGEYIGPNHLNGIFGEWVVILLSTSMRISGYKIVVDSSSSGQAPCNWAFMREISSVWEIIDDRREIDITWNDWKSFDYSKKFKIREDYIGCDTYDVYDKWSYYDHFGLIVPEVFSGNNVGIMYFKMSCIGSTDGFVLTYVADSGNWVPTAPAGYHVHSNKAELDLILSAGSRYIITTVERSNLHTHANKTIIDDITNAGSGLVITAGERTQIGTNTTDISTLQGTSHTQL